MTAQQGSYVDDKGYLRDKYGKLVHRKIAYQQIYKLNRDKYPLPFGMYHVHHIDENKLENKKENLYICIKEVHDYIHYVGRRFKTTEDIDTFLRRRKNKNLNKFKVKKPTKKKRLTTKEKPHHCLDCGRAIRQSGRCLACNSRRKRERYTIKEFQPSIKKPEPIKTKPAKLEPLKPILETNHWPFRILFIIVMVIIVFSVLNDNSKDNTPRIQGHSVVNVPKEPPPKPPTFEDMCRNKCNRFNSNYSWHKILENNQLECQCGESIFAVIDLN